MACRRCRNLAAEWSADKEAFNRLNPLTEAAARQKIKEGVLIQVGRVSDCCGSEEARRLLSSIWPDLSS